MKMKYAMTGAVALALAGCGATNTTAPGQTAPSGADTCNAASYAGLVGQDAVVALQIPDPKRSYRPDEAITQDLNPARVNVVLDETDVITAITCG